MTSDASSGLGDTGFIELVEEALILRDRALHDKPILDADAAEIVPSSGRTRVRALAVPCGPIVTTRWSVRPSRPAS